MFSTDFIFREENLVDNQRCQAGFKPLCNKILVLDCKYVSQVDSLGDDRKILFIRFCKVILWYTNELILMRKAYRQYKPVFTLLHY